MKKTTYILLFVAAFSLSSCHGSSAPINTLVLTTRWPVISPTQWTAIKQDLAAGNRTLDDVQFRRLSCDFIADYRHSPAPQVRLNGMPGNPGFNMTFSSIRLIGTPSSSSCVSGTNAIPTEVLIQSDRGIVIGQVNKGSVITVTFMNETFTGDYTEFTLTSVNPGNHSATGRFQMFATNHANPRDDRVLIVVGGSFSGTF